MGAVVNLSLPMSVLSLHHTEVFRRPAPRPWKPVPSLHAKNNDHGSRKVRRMTEYQKAGLRAAATKKKKALLKSLKKAKAELSEATLLAEKGNPGSDGWPGAPAGEARISFTVKKQRELALATVEFLSEEVKRIEALINVQDEIIRDSKMP